MLPAPPASVLGGLQELPDTEDRNSSWASAQIPDQEVPLSLLSQLKVKQE